MALVPTLIWNVGGWPKILADAMGKAGPPYTLRHRSGFQCELRPGTSDWWIFLEVFVLGIYRRAAEDARRSAVVIDIGANVGLFAIYAASLSRQAEVHAFEPFPANFRQIERNLAMNPGYRLKPHRAAVSDATGEARLFFTQGDSSGCSLNQMNGESITVPTIGVNEIFRHCGVLRCDLLKMDCEGSELPLLEKATPELLGNIGAIIMEFHNRSEVPRICEILSRNGFVTEIIEQINTIYASRKDWQPVT
jgi:FkbM family methyltransferase